MTVRRNSRRRASSPKALAANLPSQLRSFDRWLYQHDDRSSGIEGYMRELILHLPTHANPAEVVAAAGLSVAGWYRAMLTSVAGSRPRADLSVG